MKRITPLTPVFSFAAVAWSAFGLLVTSIALPAQAAERPNIVMIMADDMGYSDLGCYGGEIQTPNLDSLAAGGIRFINYYTNCMCVPTRGSLMTGLYPGQALRKDTMTNQAVALPAALKAAGYTTLMAGKWHLSQPGDEANAPNGRGFDHFYGTIHGASDFFAPRTLQRDGVNVEDEWKDGGYYYTGAMTDNALTFVKEAVEETPEKPFFLYLAYTAAHWPLHAHEEDIAKYKGAYHMGWDALRKQRHEKMKELGVVNADWPLSPRNEEVPPWEDAEEPAWQERRMEVYAAQVDRMDQNIGRLLSYLKESGQWENTLIVFQVDNGGCHVEFATDREGEYLHTETVDGRPIRKGNIPGLMPGGQETFQSYGYGWANASNTPFRYFKLHDHEGGIRSPFIVHWPAVVKDGGKIEKQVGRVMDLYPTFLDVAGATLEAQGEWPAQTLEGTSLLPVIKGGTRTPPETMAWRWSNGAALRQGKWKLVHLSGRPDWELYDVEADGTELNDLAARMPDKVAELEALYNAWAERTGAKERKTKRRGKGQ